MLVTKSFCRRLVSDFLNVKNLLSTPGVTEHWTSEHSNISEHPNIQTFGHLDTSEHSNIDHFNVQKIANINKHSNMNVRRSVTPDQHLQLVIKISQNMSLIWSPIFVTHIDITKNDQMWWKVLKGFSDFLLLPSSEIIISRFLNQKKNKSRRLTRGLV